MMIIVRLMTGMTERNAYHLMYAHRKKSSFILHNYVSSDVNASSEIQYPVVSSPVYQYGAQNCNLYFPILSSLQKTKNWSGRNDVTETSGRLYPLWPENKWLHMLRTTYYRHTRQVRWIQTELAFTLAKNATKPNPFEIIPLQTTRKNNWKTEEALARAAVTLETERIKGSSPRCLWWWLLLELKALTFKT